jgi:glycine cleavage system H protein
MKEISELKLPDDVRYSEDHEWARREGGKIKIGISDYAQDRLGDITFVELPDVGKKFKQGEVFGAVESTKAASEMLIPVGGEILAVNSTLIDSPGLVNEDPYGGGWIIEVRPGNPAEFDSLMTRDSYAKTLEGKD